MVIDQFQSSTKSNFFILFHQAVHLDGSEVTLWQRLGAAAIKVKDFELALIAFQEVSLFIF